jgi:O-antigen ligase
LEALWDLEWFDKSILESAPPVSGGGRGQGVFPNDLDRIRFPLKTRLWGVYTGTLVMVVVAAAIISPRTLPFTTPLLLLATLQAAWHRGMLAGWRPEIRGGFALYAAFAVYVAASAVWAEMPLVPAGHALGLAACFGGSALASRAFMSEPRRNIFHIAEGYWFALGVGMIYLLVEILTHQGIKLYVYNALGLVPGELRPPSFFTWKGTRLIAIAPDDLKRSVAAVSMMIWPGLLALCGTAPQRAVRWLSVAFVALAFAVVLLSVHSTSKGALTGGALVFALAQWRPVWGDRALRMGWVAACLAVIPMALLLHRVNLHKAAWIQPSMQHRIVIWNFTAEQTLKAPVLGIGAGMMYERFGSQIIEKEPESYDPRVPHAHNLYLQIWFELGVIGAAFLTLMGLAILERIRRLGPRIAPFAQATFTSAAIVASSSYGMWQGWFLILFALTVVLFAIAVRSVIHKQQMPGLSGALP